MVVKSTSAPTSPTAEQSNSSSSSSADPLRGVQHHISSATTCVSKSGKSGLSKETEVEFGRLKSLVPAISRKQSVSKLDVILEAIRYIDQLQDQLVSQIADSETASASTPPSSTESSPAKTTTTSAAAAAAAAALAASFSFVGKENTDGDLLRELQQRRNGGRSRQGQSSRNRRRSE